MICRCDACGAELEVGSWPFCPHGLARHAIQTNEAFIGGLTIENLGHEPVTVYSREEFKEAMRRANVEQRIRHVPGDHYLVDWAAGIDAQTLENARVLVSRVTGGEIARQDPAALSSYRAEIRMLGKGGAVTATYPLGP